jgi:hypothetical protein
MMLGNPVLLKVRRRRKKAKVPPATMAYDASPGWLREGRQPELVAEVVEELEGCNAVGVGPLVRGLTTTTPSFYFVLASADHQFFTLIAGGEDRVSATRLRAAVVLRLLQPGAPRLVRAFDDELELAEWALRQWPNDPAATTIVETITAERKRG